jgi:hypothetical protein
VLQAIGELVEALHQDPQVCLLHRFVRTYFLAILHRPLLRGLVLGDADLLGKLAKPGSARDARHRLMSCGYFQLLADHRLLRDDLDPEAIADAFQATFEPRHRPSLDGQGFARLGVNDKAQYLNRPDGHVGYRCGGDDLAGLQHYLAHWLPTTPRPA